jgi:hypothetical protein
MFDEIIALLVYLLSSFLIRTSHNWVLMKLTCSGPVQYKFITSKYKIFICRYRGLMPRLLKTGRNKNVQKLWPKKKEQQETLIVF